MGYYGAPPPGEDEYTYSDSSDEVSEPVPKKAKKAKKNKAEERVEP